MQAMKRIGAPMRLSKQEINALPLFHYDGEIRLVQDNEELKRAVHILRNERILGLDTETRPSFRKGKGYDPSLVQLAGENVVFLFHLKRLPFAAPLVDLLEDCDIIKAGVAINDDIRILDKLHHFSACSIVDIALIARNNSMENQGLRGLAACFLGVRISKSEQCSNWGAMDLTPRQIRYAATDAWASRAVYMRMLEIGLVE